MAANTDTDLINNVSKLYKHIGIVVGIADCIVHCIGMCDVGYNETVDIVTADGVVPCLILNVESSKVSAVVLTSDVNIKPGQYVVCSRVLLRVPACDGLLGRIVDPLGNPLDNKGRISTSTYRMVESVAPSIISRSPVKAPLETGLKIVDSLIPIGHGQRELIIGDSKTGKTSIAIDTILNQKNEDTLCIYVAIGQKRSSLARIAKTLEMNDCLKSTIIVAATASDTAAFQFLAPYSGVAMGEYFMNKGLRVLIIYDDLTKHGVSYRQLSLLLRRPPGREGYPGDVFFAHSRLLERAANMKDSGSITALPIVETIQSDVSAYIPTNVISITDGQIFLETELFSKGIRPAVSPGLSVSRVGSAAQNGVLRSMAGSLKLELAQFREVESFSKFGLTMDDATKQLVSRGYKLTKLLIQKRFVPVLMDCQIIFLFSALQGYLDLIATESVANYENQLYSYYNKSVYKYPLQGELLPKVNSLDKDIVSYLIIYFTIYFNQFKEYFITL
jgi:F-type H+-transporting ATPase subunit alpha